MNELIAAGMVIICQVSLFLIGVVLIKRCISRFLTLARLYFEPKPGGKPSEFAELTSILSKTLASDIVASIKMTLLASNSAAVRTEQAMAKREMSAASPLIGMLMKKFPGLGKTLIEHPELAQMAISKLGTMGGAPAGMEERPGNNHDSNPFNII